MNSPLFLLVLFLAIPLGVDSAEENDLTPVNPLELLAEKKEEETPQPDPSFCSIQLSNVITSTLKDQWGIQAAEAEVFEAKGLLQEAGGAFNLAVSSLYRYEWLQNRQELGLKTKKAGNQSSADLAITQPTRLGTLFSSGGVIQRLHDPIAVSEGLQSRDQFTFFIELDQPVLQGFLYGVDAVREQVACLEVKAKKWDLLFSMAFQLRESIARYWDLLFSTELLQVQINTEQRFISLAESTKELVEKKRVAASELNQQYAEIFKKKRERENAEQLVYSSFRSLLIAMGQNPCDLPLQVPQLQLESFPENRDDSLPPDVNALADCALKNRGDYLSETYRLRQTEWLVRSAKNQTLPSLNARLRMNVHNNEIGNRGKRFFSATHSRLPATDYTAELNFSYPLCNDAARGELKQQRGLNKQTAMSVAELGASIRADVASAVRDHVALAEQIRQAKQSVLWYEKAVKDETERFIEGYGSLFIIINYEDRLNAALVNHLINVRDYAINLANIAFLTGKLVTPDSTLNQARISDTRNLCYFAPTAVVTCEED